MTDFEATGPEPMGQPVPPPIPPVPPQRPPMQPMPPYRPVPPPAKSRWWLFPLGVGCGCFIPLVLIIMFGIIAAGMSGSDFGGSKVALIHVDGVITAGTSGGFFESGVGGSETIIKSLERARKDPDVKSIVLRINSPGGSAAGSEEIYREIQRVRQSKPVYVSMGDVAASGGYYIAAASDRIYADGSTLTGSIGVIMETTDLSGLFKKLGISPEVIKSGPYKDMGSPNRPMTAQEKQLIQDMINDTYDQFVTAVSQGRNMPKDKVLKLATGRVFTGRQAKKLGLVDEIGGLSETVRAAAMAGGITGEAKLVDYGRGSGIFGAFGETTAFRRLTAHDYDLIADQVVRRLANQDSDLKGIK